MKLHFLIVIFLFMISAGVSALDLDVHFSMRNADEAVSPRLIRDSLFFTFKGQSRTRVVALAFEHEGYGVFHTYRRNDRGLFVLAFSVPRDRKELRYRLVVDGVWTVDPHAESILDERSVPVSRVFLPGFTADPVPGVNALGGGRFHFVYLGEPGLRVSLIGDFNRWDPYLTPMHESEWVAGRYEAVMDLPRGPQHYRYVVDGRSIVDPANPLFARNGWSEVVSRVP